MKYFLCILLVIIVLGFRSSEQDSLSIMAGLSTGDYASLNYALGTSSVSAGGFQPIVSSLTTAAQRVEILDTSGAAIYFAVGAQSSESRKFIIVPGGVNQYYINLPVGSRISLQTHSTGEVVSSGKIYMNFFGQLP